MTHWFNINLHFKVNFSNIGQVGIYMHVSNLVEKLFEIRQSLSYLSIYNLLRHLHRFLNVSSQNHVNSHLEKADWNLYFLLHV